MNWTDLYVFIPLAVLCNTVLPVPFDPVLIVFASRQSVLGSCVLAVAGAVCAGIAAGVDVRLMRRLHRRTPERWLGWLPLWKGRQIYILTFLFALLPLPFSVVRLAVLRQPPPMIPYQVVVALGRLPRYLVTIWVWPSLGLPPGSALVLLGLAVAFVGIRRIRNRGQATRTPNLSPKFGVRVA
jgi:membrane protein YqaA with SNARE-associated domain